jgi:hypothetical protein
VSPKLRVSRYVVLNIVALLLLASPSTADDDLRVRAAAAFEAARAHTLREPLEGRLDAVWQTDLLLQIRPDPQLKWWADVRRPLLESHETYRLIEPTAPLYPLPDDPGTGLDKWYVYMRAPFGTPPSTALRFVADYLGPELAAPETGYILTHQLAVLEWAKEAGLELPAELLAKKPILLERISAKHANDDQFSDLFAERIMFVVVYGDPTDEELERSVRVIIDAQVEPGVWAPPPVTLTYDGESRHTEVEPEHARKMSMVTLAEYLARTAADTAADTDTGTDADTDTGTGTGTGTGIDAGTDTDTDTDTGTGTGADTGTDTGLAFWLGLASAGLVAVIFILARRFRRP